MKMAAEYVQLFGVAYMREANDAKARLRSANEMSSHVLRS